MANVVTWSATLEPRDRISKRNLSTAFDVSMNAYMYTYILVLSVVSLLGTSICSKCLSDTLNVDGSEVLSRKKFVQIV